ncbi:MAG: flagellar motor protein MotB [Pseudomonadota bacterium]
MVDQAPIIIIIKKRRKKQAHDSHGGSWKIAYADFVTAMMAFFMLMWLLSVTSEEQKKGIADYFSPTIINMQTQNGSAGMMGGVNMSNPNNSSGKSTEERAKSTEIEVDLTKSKQQEAFQEKKDVSKIVQNAAKDIKVELTNKDNVKKNDPVNVVEVTVSLITSEKSDASKEKVNPTQIEKVKPEKVQTEKMKQQNDQANVNASKDKPELIKSKAANAAPPKAEPIKAEDAIKTEAAQSDAKKQGAVIEKIVKVDLQAIKEAKKQAEKNENEAKALNQAINTLKSNNAAASFERSIESAKSEKTIEQQKSIEKEMAESKEKAEAIKKLQKEEAAKLTKVAASIKDIIQKSPELQGLLQHVILEIRPEGLRIQLIDKDKRTMFASGSSSMTPLTKQLIRTVAGMIEKLPNALVISGHTDAHPFVGAHKYSNWELSADRANATRRALEECNIAATRFESVMGKEATDPFVKEDPFAESNRRISITLLRQFGIPSSESFKQVTGGA